MVKRGELWWVQMPMPRGSEPGHRRPAVIVQADAYNRSAIQTVIVVVVTSNLALAEAPGNILLKRRDTRLARDSVANVSQVATIDRDDLVSRIAAVPSAVMDDIDAGLRRALQL